MLALKKMLFAVAIVASSLAQGGENPNGYSHGNTTCLQGNDGPGIRLRLRQNSRCESQMSYPYLQIDLRELPISAHKGVTIGDNNWAFRCRTPKNSCEQALSGQVVFDHFEETSGKGIQTDGYYELIFSAGPNETARFKVDCIEPCG